MAALLRTAFSRNLISARCFTRQIWEGKQCRTLGKKAWPQESSSCHFGSSRCMGTASEQGSYEEVYKRSIESPEEFWAEKAEDIVWFKPFDKVLDNSNPPFSKWFVGGQLNTCYNALDLHVEQGRGDKTALIWDSPVSGNVKKFTYKELRDEAANFARVLTNYGVKKGDRVIIYMPMVPEAAIAMYGCARIGAIHSVVFGGFAPNELARRIDDASPKVIVTASCGIEPHRLLPYGPLVQMALEMVVHPPEKVIVLDRPQQSFDLKPGRDIGWHEAMADVTSPHDCVPLDSNDPLYILYTSGTTGKPKGILRSNGGHAVALKWTMKNLYGIDQNETWWTASDIGWVVGHSYIIYAPLLYGCTSVMFEGKPINCPDGSVFFRVIDDHDVASLFTAPTAMRVIRNEDPDGHYAKDYRMSKFRAMFLAGEHADVKTLEWTKKTFRSAVLDHWWQTETGWPMTCHSVGLGLPDNYPFGSCGRPCPGWNVKVVNRKREDCKPGEVGTVAVKLPLPPGALTTLWRSDDRFINAYHSTIEGHYDSFDSAEVDENGYIIIHGRIDDLIQVAGHRLSTKQMEMAIAKHPDIIEQAVIGVKDEIKGEVPVGLIVLREGVDRHEDDIFREVIELVRREVGQVSSFKRAIILPTLPKTRSQKFVRSTLKKMANQEFYTMPQTVENEDDFKKVELILMKEFPGGMYK